MNSVTKDITISVTNVNDVKPVISIEGSAQGDGASISGGFDENDTGSLIQIAATDAEGDSITYSISGTDASLMSISTAGVISFKSVPDYESKTSYSFIINASDGVNTATLNLTVAIVNVNDVKPVISISGSALPDGYSASGDFDENDTGSLITVAASDAEGDSITFSLSGTDAASFNISSSGVITFKSTPNYEAKNSYAIIVNANDGVNNATLNLAVNIQNVNEFKPIFTLGSSDLPDGYTASGDYDENDTGALITVTAKDGDGDSLSFSLSGTDASLFSISNKTISFKNSPDYESKTSYSITVIGSDGEKTASINLNIAINNLNDVAPIITSTASYSAAENQTTIGTVSVNDPEGGSFTFSLSGTDASSINVSSSGALTFASAPNYEVKTSYSFVLTVSDGTNSSSKNISISITDVNENIQGYQLPVAVKVVGTE